MRGEDVETDGTFQFGTVGTAQGLTPTSASPNEAWTASSETAHTTDELQNVTAARKLWEALDEASVLLPPWDALSATPRFDGGAKTPCWQTSSGEAASLPYAYILGPFQSGVDDMLSRLRTHRDVKVGRTAKSHFYYEARSLREFLVTNLADVASATCREHATSFAVDASAGTFTFYLAHTADRTMLAWKRAIQDCHRRCFEGASAESGRLCMSQNCFRQALDEQAQEEARIGARVELPHLLRAMHGTRVRLVALLRDPVERLHASFWFHEHYRRRYGATPQGFANFARESVDAMQRCRASGSTRECALRFEAHGIEQEDVFFHCDQLIRGMHDVFAETWLATFPRELLLVKAEEYFADTRRVLSAVARHFGIEANATWLDKALSLRRVRASDGLRGAGGGPGGSPSGTSMDARTRRMLQAFYAPHNRRLDAMTSSCDACKLPGTRFVWGYES